MMSRSRHHLYDIARRALDHGISHESSAPNGHTLLPVKNGQPSAPTIPCQHDSETFSIERCCDTA